MNSSHPSALSRRSKSIRAVSGQPGCLVGLATRFGPYVLVVGGTLGDDSIVLSPAENSGIDVTLNDVSLGVFQPTSRLVAYGQDGDDDIQVAGSIGRAAWLYGGDGHDRLKGGAGDDVLLGGDGEDFLAGGNGRDLLLGGTGADRILGNAGDDILIAGTTDFDAHETSLALIMQE